jgi:hypothetical protein
MHQVAVFGYSLLLRCATSNIQGTAPRQRSGGCAKNTEKGRAKTPWSLRSIPAPTRGRVSVVILFVPPTPTEQDSPWAGMTICWQG